MFSNPIEKIVRYLHEVGDPILTIAATVERNADALKQAEAEVVRCRHKVKESRRLLLTCVKHHYVVSEIETADAMCNRLNNCLQAR
jgi:pyruvate kinase